MTHRPYTPPAWQSKPLADGRVTLLVVPLKVQPNARYPNLLSISDGAAYFCDGGHPRHHDCEEYQYPIKLPYAPGDLIWCRETWSGEYAFRDVIPSQRESVFTPDGLFLRDNIWYWADGSPEFGDFERPRSPVTMPKWASRTWLRCTGVEVRRVQTISEDEVRRVGLESNDGTVLRGKFNPWDANPWCAFTTVEKISKEDV